VPHLCKVYPGICVTAEEKSMEKLSQGSWNESRIIIDVDCRKGVKHVYTWRTKHAVFNFETDSTCGNYCVLHYSVTRQMFSVNKLFVMFV